jgi:hypothetical protein
MPRRQYSKPKSGNILRCPLAHFYSAVENKALPPHSRMVRKRYLFNPQAFMPETASISKSAMISRITLHLIFLAHARILDKRVSPPLP